MSNDLFSKRVTRVYEQIYEQITKMEFLLKTLRLSTGATVFMANYDFYWRWRFYIYHGDSARSKYTLLLWAGLVGMGF